MDMTRTTIKTPTSNGDTYTITATPCRSGKLILADNRGRTQVVDSATWTVMAEALLERGGELFYDFE